MSVRPADARDLARRAGGAVVRVDGGTRPSGRPPALAERASPGDGRAARRPRTTELEARVDGVGEPLSSPAGGVPCVWFRLRVQQRLASGLSLVHDIASEVDFELAWRDSAHGPPQRLRVDAASMQVSAAPVVYEPGSPGARAVAARWGWPDSIRVEEIAIRAGECVLARGLVDETLDEQGPFRGGHRVPDLVGAHLELPSHTARAALMRTAVLPWALGTAAAIVSGMGLAAVAVHKFRVVLGHAVPTAGAVVAPADDPRVDRAGPGGAGPRTAADHPRTGRLPAPHPRLP